MYFVKHSFKGKRFNWLQLTWHCPEYMYLLQWTKQILLHMLLHFTLTKCFRDLALPLLFWILWRYNILSMSYMFS